MTREEYEARRRRLDEELRSAVELLKAGHQAQMQMLDLLWKTTAAAADASKAPQPSAPPEPPRRKRGPGSLVDEIIEILPRLPKTFTKVDVERLLDEPAERTSLFRAFQELQRHGWLKADSYGQGRHPTVYRNIRTSSATPATESGDAGEPS